MSTAIPDVVGRLRQPEYTGENRCMPCTVTNLVITAVLGAGIWFVLSPPWAAGFAAVSVAAIYFRGYLVPGTPELTKRYFPVWLLRLFGKAGTHEPIDVEEVDVEEKLVESHALTECENLDDLCLEDDFREQWRDRIAAHREQDTGREALAELIEVESGDVDFEEFGDGEAFVATVEGNRVGQWESRAAFLADVAAAELLDDRIDDWSELPITGRSQLLGGLRLFLDECPNCDGNLDFGEDTVESCCRTMDVVAVTCNECDSRVFEAEYSPEAAA